MKWSIAVLVAALASGSVGCRRDAAARPASRYTVRDDARGILERHCGSCHNSALPSALPGALAVYDLSECDWSHRMTEAQLKDALFRLGEPLPPDGEQNRVSREERQRFGAFVDAEITRRRAIR